MLHSFLTIHRDELVARCRSKVVLRPPPETPETDEQMEYGIGLFLDQLIKTLQVEQTSEPMLSRKVSGPAGGVSNGPSEIGASAGLHGRELLLRGFTIEQVVHDYGDLCQAITDMAFELDEPIEIDEFRTFNRCLDNAIADAVTEFSYQRDFVIADQHDRELNERLGFFAHESRNLLHTATLALKVVQTGKVGMTGATSTILERSLLGLTNLIDRSLAEVRVLAGLPVQNALYPLNKFIAEVKLAASLDADSRECVFTVAAVDPKLAVDVDRELLFSAVGNLLQNAFKFTHSNSEVTLSAYSSADRILIDVEDRCGGLAAGSAESMFAPFTQNSENKTGLGLGLSIARRSVEANQGILSVRDIPGSGCVFTIDLPRHASRN